jgi:hypothetical protein
VTGLWLALVLCAAAPSSGTPPAVDDEYEAVVSRGVEDARAGRPDEADRAFARAIACEPNRPEAYVERGGLRFLEKRYDDAVRDLEAALLRGDDAYARELLASSLYLSGRTDDALARWNALGQPTIGRIDVIGLAHAPERLVRRELLPLEEGGPLPLDALREARLRLRELAIFRQITMRPIPKGDGKADLEVVVTEDHGLADSWQSFALSTLVQAGQGRAILRYANLGGTGVSIGGSYRWSENRPEAAAFLTWPRPFGMPVTLDLRGFRGRQAYDIEGPYERRSHGLDMALRHVFGARTVGLAALRTRDRTFSAPAGSTASPAPGLVLGLEAGVDRKLFESRRQRADASFRLFRSVHALGGDVPFTRGTLAVRHQLAFAPLEQTPIERSMLVSRVFVGQGSASTPEDEMFAVGGSPEMELPLRGHRLTDDGVIGSVPVGTSLLLVNVEWRRRLLKTSALQIGAVAFYDGARIGRADEPAESFHDVGIGLRLAPRAGPLLRIDFGHGLADGKNALFIGLSQAF